MKELILCLIGRHDWRYRGRNYQYRDCQRDGCYKTQFWWWMDNGWH